MLKTNKHLFYIAWRALPFAAASLVFAACNGGSTPGAGPLLPDAAPQSTVAPSQTAAPMSIVAVSGNTYTITGSVVAFIRGGFQIQGGQGVGYEHILTNSSTVYVGAKPYIGENVKVVASGTLSSGTLTASRVTQTSSTSTATPKPAATTASTTAYFYHGCQVYPAGDTYANNDIYNAAPSPNSAAIVSNWASVGNFDYGDTSHSETANLATNSTPLKTVQYAGGHNPPMTNGAATQVPWQSGYYIEGTYGQNSDAHSQVLNTQTCVDSEMYGTKWNGSTLGAYGGMKVNLKSSYASQYSLMGPVTVAYVPVLGFTDYGEDASLTSINHPLSFFSPAVGSKISKYGYYYPSHNGYVSIGSCTSGNKCLHLGDYIRLKASFNCGAYTRIGQLVCNQLKHYGAVYDDDAYHLGFRFGLSANGADPWNYSVNLQPLFKALTMANFDIIEKGSRHCSGSPCV